MATTFRPAAPDLAAAWPGELGYHVAPPGGAVRNNVWPLLCALLCLMLAVPTVTQPAPQQGGGQSREAAPAALCGFTIKRPLYCAVARMLLVLERLLSGMDLAEW